MLDHLNLPEIRAEIKRKVARRVRTSRITKYVFGGLIAVYIYLMIFTPYLPRRQGYSDSFVEFLDLITAILTLVIFGRIILGLILTSLAYYDDRQRAVRANAILPALLLESPIRAHARLFWFAFASWLTLGGATIWALVTGNFFGAATISAALLMLQYVQRYRLRLEVRLLYKGALARGDYDAALRQVDTFLRWMPHNLHYLNAKGFMLLLAGRNEEVEQYFRQILPLGQRNPVYLTAFMVNLGAALMQQERHDEAFPFLEAATQIMPEYKEYTANLAGYYLARNIYPERALELMEYTLEGVPQPKSNHFLEGYIWSNFKILEARAAAFTGRATRAEAALEAALAAADKDFLPGMAAVYLQAGYMRRSQGDSVAAQDYFSRAQKIDPNGYNGKCAARELSAEPPAAV